MLYVIKFLYYDVIYTVYALSSNTDHSPGVNRITAFMQPHSLPSGDSCLKRANISCMIFISLLTFVSSAGSLSRALFEFSSGDKSQGMDHWAKCNRNSSFHDSCRRSSCYTDKTNNSTSKSVGVAPSLFKQVICGKELLKYRPLQQLHGICGLLGAQLQDIIFFGTTYKKFYKKTQVLITHEINIVNNIN